MLWFSSKPNRSLSCFQTNLKELNKNGAIDLKLNILCVLLCPFAFIFMEMHVCREMPLACIYMSRLKEGKKADFGRDSEAQSQRSHFIVNLFCKITSLLKASVSSLKRRKQKSKQADTKPCDNWVKIRVKSIQKCLDSTVNVESEGLLLLQF